MVNVTITVKGIPGVSRWLDPKKLNKSVQRAVKSIAEKTRARMAVYPPETIANSPANPLGRWYQRHFGPRWKRRDGSIGGRQTSEVLGKSWVWERVGVWGARIFTRARGGAEVSYSPFVVGDEQSAVMARIGWDTTEEVAEWAEKNVVDKEIDAALRKAFG